jgi:hypothetical protein
MPKSRFAARGKPKPKSVKAKVPLSSKRKLSRFGEYSVPCDRLLSLHYSTRLTSLQGRSKRRATKAQL